MSRSSVVRASVFCAAFLLTLAAAPRVAAKPLLSEKQIFDQLNQERQKAGLPILEWNEPLAEAARSHSLVMAENDKLAHQLAGEPPLQERIALQGVRFTRAGENVALTGHLEDVHLGLMGSPGHRANMLSPKYNAVGIGVIEQNGKIYVTQDFAFQVPVYSEAEFGAALAERLQLPRKATGVWEVNAKPDPLMHNLACSTDGDAAKLSNGVSGSYLVVFSASEPRLPEEVQKAVTAKGYYHMKFGVCFRPDKEHGPGNFWVVAAFS